MYGQTSQGPELVPGHGHKDFTVLYDEGTRFEWPYSNALKALGVTNHNLYRCPFFLLAFDYSKLGLRDCRHVWQRWTSLSLSRRANRLVKNFLSAMREVPLPVQMSASYFKESLSSYENC